MEMSKTKAVGLFFLVLLVCSMLPTMLLARGQANPIVDEEIVGIAERAGDQIENLVTSVYANENATERMQNMNLTQQFEDSVAIYQEKGLEVLLKAQEALANSDFNNAVDFAFQALAIFREVYSSLQAILEKAGLQDNYSLDAQGLSEAINRDLQKLSNIQKLLPQNTTQETMNLFDTSINSLLEAKQSLQDAEYQEAQALYLEAKQQITQIYQYLKNLAQESNPWRLNIYCEGLQQRIQEQFRYGAQNHIDFSVALKSLGYQSENQFMQSLQNRIQDAESQANIGVALEECLSISQMVQQMEQALNQEIIRQQGPNPSNGSAGPNGPDNATGSNSTNTSGKGTN
jgi:hypothetical protein